MSISFNPTPAPAASSYGAAAGAGLPGAASSPADSPRAEFEAYVKMTPAQRMRALILKDLGVTEDQIKAMSPEDRRKIEDQIQQLIKKHAQDAAEKGKTGLIADISA